jgi:hypothetical protein
MHGGYVVTCWSGGKTAIFGTGASNGSFESAADDRQIWESGGMEIGRENQKIPDKILPQCYFDHHKSHTDYAGIEPEPPL